MDPLQCQRRLTVLIDFSLLGQDNALTLTLADQGTLEFSKDPDDAQERLDIAFSSPVKVRCSLIGLNGDTPPPHPRRNRLAEVGQLLEEAVLGLPDQYRAVVMLRDIEELSTAETAAAHKRQLERFTGSRLKASPSSRRELKYAPAISSNGSIGISPRIRRQPITIIDGILVP